MLDESLAEQEKPRHPGGRPTKYKPEYAKQAAKLCNLGATDKELADFFDVSINTIDNWKVAHEEFLGAITVAKDAFDNRVERSLYQKAVGYTYDAVKIMQYEGQVIEVPYREHVPPDTASMIFWLKNRRKDQWRDRIEQEHTHKHTFSDQFEDFIRQLTGKRAVIEADATEVQPLPDPASDDQTDASPLRLAGE